MKRTFFCMKRLNEQMKEVFLYLKIKLRWLERDFRLLKNDNFG